MKVYPVMVFYPIENLVRDMYDSIRDKVMDSIKDMLWDKLDNVEDLDFSIEESPYENMVDDLIENNAQALLKLNDKHEISFTGNIHVGNKIIPVKELSKSIDDTKIDITYKVVTAYHPAHMSEYDIRYGSPEPASWDYDEEKLTIKLSDLCDVSFSDMIELPSEEEILKLQEEEQKDVSDFIR